MADFKLGDLVLVRDSSDDIWVPYQYITTKNGNVWFSDGTWLAERSIDMILLSSENEHLVGTNQTPIKPWEPKCGELVAVKDSDDPYWSSLVFIGMSTDGKYRCGWSEDTDFDETVTWDQCEPIYKHFKFSKNPEDKDA